jgi:pilus assembly protein FimV
VRKTIIRASLIAGGILCLPLTANSAGMGKLTVTSALGQPLRAEVELIADAKEDVASFSARMASFDVYREAKLERAPVLSNVRFTIEKKPGGNAVLKITSTQAVNEPFLDMLIELDWSAGRLLREYTVLLDPPGFQEAQAVTPVAVPLVKSVPAEAPMAKATAPQPEAGAMAPVPTERPRPGAKSTAKAPRPIARELTPAERTFPRFEAQPQPAETAAKAGPTAEEQTYGPVKPGDTLGKIAANLKPEGISLDQMLIGLYQANRNAFSGNNINRLRTGHILRVPEKDVLASVSESDASHQVKVHAADWNAYRQKLAAAVAAAKPAVEAEAKQAVSGKIEPSVEEKAAAKQEPSKDVLKLSKGETPEKGAVAAGGKEVKALQGKLQALEEEATAKDKSLREANSRIAELEKNIKEMQKLLEIKSQSLADLQKQAAAKPETKPEAKPEVKPEPVPAPGPTAPVAAPTPAAAPGEAAPVPLVKALPEEKAPTVLKKPAPPKVFVPQPEPEAPWYEEILANPLYLAGGVGVVLVGGLVWLLGVSRKRRKALTSFEDSIMTGGDLKANTVLGDTSGGVIDTGDTSFLTDFSQAGLGTIDTNDVDPIAEAEVYMAYGRDAQAEEILKEAMTKDPNRHEIQQKLLEIYASRKNLVAFETLAGELYAAIGGKPSAVWDKVAEMGRELDPNNPLYAVASPVVGAAEAPAAKLEPMPASNLMEQAESRAVDELGLNLEEETPAEATVAEPVTEANVEEEVLDFGQGLDFETGVQEPVEAIKSAEAKPVHEEEQPLSLDLETIIPQAVEKKSAAAETAAPARQAEEVEDFGLEHELDFDLGLDTTVAAAEAEDVAAAAAAEHEGALDFDFNLDEEVPAQAHAAEAAAHELDLSGISLELEEAPTVAEPEPVADVGGEEWQEVATKLDLAKAYLEMGDKEGAREILQEVADEGNSQQQTDAKALLAELA